MSLAPCSWYSLLISARKSYLNSVKIRLNWRPWPVAYTHRGLVYKKHKSSNALWVPRGKHALCLCKWCWHVNRLSHRGKEERKGSARGYSQRERESVLLHLPKGLQRHVEVFSLLLIRFPEFSTRKKDTRLTSLIIFDVKIIIWTEILSKKHTKI